MITTTPHKNKVAIIGLGMSLPGGVEDQKSYWNLLENKIDATVDIPSDRWDAKRFYAPYESDKPGKMYVTRGGFLQREVDAFDPLFFGISPREASIMDLQQRLLLEIAVKTFQDAGYTEEHYAESNMGVFIGGFCMDAHVQAANADNRNWYISQSVTGSTATMLSNRISYIFNLKGPSLTIDTACSSSLVSAHYAVESILAGDCDTALVGGVNIMTQPEHFIEMCKGKLLSKDGRCFTWDERANGYARGEGAGMLLFKSLDAAERDGDHIYAVIEGTGVNQDGTSKGITSPNPDSQSTLIRHVLRKANLQPQDIDYVEAHGTGTQAGDTAETSALNDVFQKGRQGKLVIGSVKTNIGHLEAAAGVSGLLKAILCLSHKKIPANLHFETPNPAIPFDDMCLNVPTELIEWPTDNKTKYVGVNGFGYGGTNAHIILSEAPIDRSIESNNDENEALDAPLMLPVSGKCLASVKAVAQQYSAIIDSAENATINTLLRRVSTKRNHYDQRAFVFGADKQELLARLHNLEHDIPCEGVAVGDSAAKAEKLVFVYSGMGPQWWGMGQELFESEPLFAEKIREYDQAFLKISGWSILKEMLADEASSSVQKTQIAQPLNFAIQAALTELWLSWGIQPDAVVGHSVGEVTSAYISGMLSLDDALLVSYYRSLLQSTLAHTGGMLAVGLSDNAVLPYLERYSQQVSIAAINSPSAVTLAGEQSALDELAEQFTAQSIFNRALKVEVPYHSPLMAPIEADIKQHLASVTPKEAVIPCYSTVTGALAKQNDFDADYWWHNVRESVSFSKAITTLCKDEYTNFLEVGPHPVLNSSIKEILTEARITGHVFSSLNRKTPEANTLLESLGRLYTQGFNLNWGDIQKGRDSHMKLPIYPWQRVNCNYGAPKFIEDKFGEKGHPILYRNMQLPAPSWQVELSDSLFPYIKDHQIGNKIILPGAFYVEAALALYNRVFDSPVVCLRDISFRRILALPDLASDEETRIISMCNPEKDTFRIFSTTTAPQENWAFHMEGHYQNVSNVSAFKVQKIPCTSEYVPADITAFYQTVANNGLQYGPYFQPIKNMWSKNGSVVAELTNTLDSDDSDKYLLPPPVLDGIFQTMFCFGGDYNVPFVPVKIEQLIFNGKVSERCTVVGQLLWISATSLKADFTLFDEEGQPIVELSGVTCQALAPMTDGAESGINTLYNTMWEPLDSSDFEARSVTPAGVITLFDEREKATALTSLLAQSNSAIAFSDFETTAFEQLIQQRDIDAIVYMCEAPTPLANALNQSVDHCARITDIVKALHKSDPAKTIRLYLCTQQACKVLDSDRVDGISSSSLIGLCRTINTEHPNIECSSVDFTHATYEEFEIFCREVFELDMGIQELAIRGHSLYQHLLSQLDDEEEYIETTESRFRQEVAVRDFGSLEHDEFPFSGCNTPLSGAEIIPTGSVKIEADYFTLSYWDSANSQLQVFPEDPSKHFFQYRAGMQCVGYIDKYAEDVVGFTAGDCVLSLHPHGIKNFSIVPRDRIFKIPQSLSNVRLPDVYEIFRAKLALRQVALTDKSLTLLVYGNWSAFTQTLIAYCAEHNSTVIFVDEDCSPLAEMDVKGLDNVRYFAESAGWEESVESVCSGVDILVNNGRKNFSQIHLLNAFANVIDFKSSQMQRALEQEVPPRNCTYHIIDVDYLFAHNYAYVRTEIENIVAELAHSIDEYPPLPAFELRDIATAAAELKGGSTAALHVTMKNETVPLRVEHEEESFELAGTYIVTGGTQGFGLQCAQWLVEKGAKHLVLMSRSGLKQADAITVVDKLRASGVQVEVCAVDITNAESLKEAVAKVTQTLPPIKGVLHSAMVLGDAYLEQLDRDQFARVLAPKIQGAINLASTLDTTRLDFFLMFSSISSLIGNAGQANYVAANSFLDSFAHYLESRGVPAKTINWGALSDSGVLASNESLVKVLELAGIYGVSNRVALGGMEKVLLGTTSQTGIFHIDWNQWSKSNPSLSQSGFYQNLLDAQNNNEDRIKLMEVLENIIDKDSEERTQYVQHELAVRFGAIFKMPAEAINPNTSIIDLGVDSLMAVEISMALKTQLGVDIPTIELISGPSIAMLATKILVQIEELIEEVMSDYSEEGSTEETDMPEINAG